MAAAPAATCSPTSKRESLDFPDSIRYLAERAGIELSEERSGPRRGPRRTRVLDCLQEAEKYYNTQLMRGRGDGPAAGRRYLSGRGFGSDVCRRWGLGFALGHGALTEHLRAQGFSRQELVSADLALEGQGGRLRDRFYDRVMFPIHDEQGRTIAFGGRVMTDAKPKYLNTKETAVFSKESTSSRSTAPRTPWSRRAPASCARVTRMSSPCTRRASPTPWQPSAPRLHDGPRRRSSFARKRIICMFDGDGVGQRAAERAVRHIDKTGVEMLCVVLPNNQDPMEFLRDHGADALRPILAAAQPLMDFVFGAPRGLRPQRTRPPRRRAG